MASLFSSRLLLRHTKPSIHSLARVTPLALLVRPFSHTPLPHSSSPFDPPSSSTLDYSQLHPAFKLVPAKAINHQTPLRLAHSPEEERDGKMRDLPRPKREMDVGGEGLEVPSETDGGKVYLLKRFLHHGYSCTCLSWQFQKKRAIDVRSCKHLRGLLGDEYEDARTGDSGRTKAKKPTTTTRKTSSAAAAVASTSAAAAPAPPASKDAEAGATKKPVKRPAGAAVKGKGKGRAFAEDAMEDEEASPLTDPEDGDVQMADALGIGKGKGKGKMSGRKGGMDLLLANKFDLQSPAVVEGGKKDPKGWWVSEKLDGVRAYWDGQGTLWSRVGNPFSAPASFLAHLPRGTTLDGELFLGRDRFDETSGIVRTKEPGPGWGGIRYLVFDIPSLGDSPFEARQSALESLFPLAPAHILSATSVAAATTGMSQEGKRGEGVVWTVRQEKCRGLEDLKGRLEEVSRLGGEGLMLRLPHSPYIPRRSSTLLKVKTFHDAEAVVVDYEPGKGKYEGMVGALVCRMERGEVFSVGSGLTDERRGRPPPIGSTITYRFQELTKAGIPRFPTFVGERADLQGAKDAKGARRSA